MPGDVAARALRRCSPPRRDAAFDEACAAAAASGGTRRLRRLGERRSAGRRGRCLGRSPVAGHVGLAEADLHVGAEPGEEAGRRDQLHHRGAAPPAPSARPSGQRRPGPADRDRPARGSRRTAAARAPGCAAYARSPASGIDSRTPLQGRSGQHVPPVGTCRSGARCTGSRRSQSRMPWRRMQRADPQVTNGRRTAARSSRRRRPAPGRPETPRRTPGRRRGAGRSPVATLAPVEPHAYVVPPSTAKNGET